MIYQPRNVQPSGVSIDGLLDNTFTMEIQTNSYVSAYQLLIVDFDNNEIYTGSKTTLTNYAYNGDTLEIPVNASTVALSNGTNYKWRVRLYQPTADMLITYGLVQATSTTTTIYLQPNINIKAGMAITINSQTKTISSYNSDTGVAVVSSAFASAPAVGTQYKIYSDFIETVPDYIVYARQTPAVTISNVPSSLTLKYHTFQGTYTQSDNVAIVYHQFDLYTRNDDGIISLVASSDKVYSANLSYTYDSFRTGNKYLIQMTVENDMGVITTTDMYEFNVSYDIVEYLQQPLASFDDKNNAVKVSWVTPVENEATSFRSDAATGIIQDNNNTLTQATFEPGQSIGEGDVVQITNSDCSFIINGETKQNAYSGKNLLNTDILSYSFEANTNGYVGGTTTTGIGFGRITLNANTKYYISYDVVETGTTNVRNTAILVPIDGSDYKYQYIGQYNTTTGRKVWEFTPTETKEYVVNYWCNNSNKKVTIANMMVSTDSNISYEPYVGGKASPNPDYPQEIEVGRGKNLLSEKTEASNNTYFYKDNGLKVKAGTTYTLSCDTVVSGLYVKKKDDDTNLFVAYEKTSLTFTLTEDTVVWFDFYYSNVNNKSTKYQLEKNSVATSYLPYNTIESKSTGKNLLNVPSEYSVTGYNIVPINIPANTQFTISVESISLGGSDGALVSFKDSNGVTLGLNEYLSSTNLSATKTLTSDVASIYIYSQGNYNTSKDVTSTFNNLMISKSGGEYEPYKESSIQYNLGDNFLADKDYIENGVLNKHTGKVVLNGSESGWAKGSDAAQTENTNLFYFHNSSILPKPKGLDNLICDKFPIRYIVDPQYSVDEIGLCGNNAIESIIYIRIDKQFTLEEFKAWLSENPVTIYYELETPEQIPLEIVGDIIPQVSGKNYMNISISLNTTFSLKYPYKTISGNAYDYTEFNPPGAKQTGTIKSYNAITGIGTLMPQYPFMYTPMQGDSYAVISNIYNVSGFSYLYNTPYNTVNSLYTHGYTATWATPDGLCVLPDDFNITLQFSPDGNFYYTDDGTYQEIVDVITTETDDINNKGEFTIRIDKNKLIFAQQSEDGGDIVWDGNTEGKISAQGMLYKLSDITPSKEDLIGNKLTLTSPDEVKTFNIVAEDDGVSSDICYPIDLDDSGNYAIATLLPVVAVITTPTSTYPSTGIYFLYYDGMYVSELGLGSMILEAPFYTNTSQVFVLSSANIAQINNDYVWDDTATWTDTYTWVEGGTSLERVCNHWWKVQITNTGIKIEEIFPTT